jgi:hypothetical protein
MQTEGERQRRETRLELASGVPLAMEIELVGKKEAAHHYHYHYHYHYH